MAKSYLYPRKQKKFKKTKIIISIVLIICLILAGVYFYKTKVKHETMILQSPVVFSPETKKSSEPVTGNQSTTFNDVQLTVANKKIGEQQTGSTNVLLTYDVTIQNNSKKAIQFADTDFTLVQDGTHYTGNMNRFASIKTFQSEDIQPKKRLTRTIAFSVQPNVANGTELQLMISNPNWGTKQALIDLAK